MTLPDMVVEQRVSTTAHGLIPPAVIGSTDYEIQLSDMIVMVDAAKAPANKTRPVRWPLAALGALARYAPTEIDIAQTHTALRQFGFYSWKNCVEFVMDDNCDDFASIVLRWTQENSIPHADDLGFIDGDGTGFLTTYLKELNNKGAGARGTLEKAFDAKYFYQHRRPLEILKDRMGEEAALCQVNYVHPGHWAYPAGHGVKFFSVVKVVRDMWQLTPEQDQALLVAAYVLAMARSGGGVHYPRDNAASGYLSGLPEFAAYGT